MNNTLFLQGVQNIDDAVFVRNHLIPLARTHQRWNIVVYESHRAIELTLRAMICLSGHMPPESHDLERHINYLEKITPVGFNTLILRDGVTYFRLGELFGIRIVSTTVELIEHPYEMYKSHSTCSIPSPLRGMVNVRLIPTAKGVDLFINNEKLLSHGTKAQAEHFEGILKILSTQEKVRRFRELKKFAKRLYQKRATAFYGEVQYSREDASLAFRDMLLVLHTAEVFYKFDTRDTGSEVSPSER